MEKDTLELAQGVLEELEEALRPLEVELRRLDLEDSGGFPTVLVGIPDREGEPIVCSVLPRTLGRMGVVFLQFYISLTPQASGEKLRELERFVQQSNRRFLLGTLLIQDGRLDQRCGVALDPAVEMDRAHIQTTAAAFSYQAAIYARLGNQILDGSLTVEQALEYRE